MIDTNEVIWKIIPEAERLSGLSAEEKDKSYSKKDFLIPKLHKSSFITGARKHTNNSSLEVTTE